VSLKVSTVTTGGFTGLTTLSTGALPTGVTATFNPITLGPNASGLLTLTTSGSTPATSSIEVRGSAVIEGTTTTRNATATLNVQAAGATVLAGQVLDENEKPIPGVSIKLGGSTITTLGATDAAGNFLVTLSVAGAQVFLIDGSSANTSTVSYPTIPVTVNIQAGVVNTLPFVPHLHMQPVTQPLPVAPSVATPITFASVPDFQVTIPAGAQIIGWDGQPNTQIGVRPVPLDRLAVPPPPAGVETNVAYMFTFGKVGGGTPTAPIPVTLPNTIGAYPGQQVELWYFNEAPDGTAPNQWEMFGLGTVSNDGKLIVSNPGVGIPRFCCGATLPRRPQPPPDTPQRERAPEKSPEECECADPVDLATGILSMRSTDLHIEGQVPLTLQRTYRTLDPTVGPFGLGGRHNYDLFVRAVSTDLAVLLTPDTQRPRFARQADGSFANADRPQLRGARLTQEADGTWRLRFKEGAEWRFNSAGWLIAKADRHGNTLVVFRDSQQRVSSVADPAGREVRFTYAGSGATIQQVTDSLGRTVQYTYDAAQRLIAVTDAIGGITRYAYDAQDRLQSWTDPRGTRRAQTTYDAAGRVIEQVQADGGLWRLAYTVVAGTVVQTTETDPEGRVSVYRFGPGGFPQGVQDGQGQVSSTQREAGTNLLQGTTDPLGRSTR
jgi:YD repeat-containing protein